MAGRDLLDEVFIAAPPGRIAAAVHERRRWAGWFPGLVLTVATDRGARGIRWSVAGDPPGSCELWVEPVLDGAVVHWYLRVGLTARAAERWERHAARALLAFKDELESARGVGDPVAP